MPAAASASNKVSGSSASTLDLGGSKPAKETVQPTKTTTTIKKTIPSSKASAKPVATAASNNNSTLLNNTEWSKWQKAPKQPQEAMSMGFCADDKSKKDDDDVAMSEEENKKPGEPTLKPSKQAS